MVEQKRGLQTQIAGQDFLAQRQPIANLPEKFSFSIEARLSLFKLRKWTESLPIQTNSSEGEGREIIAAAILDKNNKIHIRDVKAGSGVSVELRYTDLSDLPHWQVTATLSTVNPQKPEFYLVPQDFNWPYAKTPNKIVEKGKKILGFIHTHPNGWPPSPQDLSGFLEIDGKETLMGVIGKDTLFLLVKTMATRRTSGGTNLDFMANKYYGEMGNYWYAINKALKENCVKYNLGFYVGDINKNEFSKVR